MTVKGLELAYGEDNPRALFGCYLFVSYCVVVGEVL